jgi:hypothetical protein
MKSTLLLVACIIASPSIALDLKGIEVGKPPDMQQIRDRLGVPDGPCPAAAEPGELTCKGETTIEGIKVKTVARIGKTGNVDDVVVTFGSVFYGMLERSVIEKYGLPTNRTVSPKKFNQISVTLKQDEWENADGTYIMLTETLTSS